MAFRIVPQIGHRSCPAAPQVSCVNVPRQFGLGLLPPEIAAKGVDRVGHVPDDELVAGREVGKALERVALFVVRSR